METVQIPKVTARRPDEPEPDLTSMLVIHRAMLADLGRLAAVLNGPATLIGTRAKAVRSYAASLLTEIDHHHANEDDLLWPVIERTAGQAIDLSPLSDDHQALGPVLARCRAVLGGPQKELGAAIAGLKELLDEHIAEEEANAFPVILRYVPFDAYVWVEGQIGKKATLGELRFTVPWLGRYATAEEFRRLLDRAGLPFKLLHAVTKARYARLERLAFTP